MLDHLPRMLAIVEYECCEFFDRAMQALEDLGDIRAAAEARKELRVSHAEVMAGFGL
jgi:hypothetical protein